jgi:hypothetical protein
MDLFIKELQRVWVEGISSGPGRFQDMDAIKTEAHRRWDCLAFDTARAET